MALCVNESLPHLCLSHVLAEQRIRFRGQLPKNPSLLSGSLNKCLPSKHNPYSNIESCFSSGAFAFLSANSYWRSIQSEHFLSRNTKFWKESICPNVFTYLKILFVPVHDLSVAEKELKKRKLYILQNKMFRPRHFVILNFAKIYKFWIYILKI